MLWKYATGCYSYEVDLYPNHIVLSLWPAGYSSPVMILFPNFCFFHFPFSQILIVVAAVPLAIFLLLSCSDNVTASLECGVMLTCDLLSVSRSLSCPAHALSSLGRGSTARDWKSSTLWWFLTQTDVLSDQDILYISHTDTSCRLCLRLALQIL